ncbi:Phosphatidylinositol-4-phosphate 5-kinase [Serendipita sp. 401]|nr:Phosphatidylinositol-4-phosphate 5-kinase [Serendipita sp. 401]
MATTLVPTTSIERERERDLPASSMQNTNHPPSSFDPSRIPSRSGSVAEPGMGHTAASSSNIANVLNTRPVYDRSTSQLGRYDSKRSSMISNSSFQTAPLVGGSNYGGASVYGTADGGTPRDSIDTVQGYEPPSTPGIPGGAYTNGHVDNGHLSPQFLQPYPQPTNATSSTSDQRPGTAGSKASSIKSSGSNPGNDLPKHLATGPSPVDIESGHLKPVASNIMPSTPPRGNIILDTSVLSASPSHSPSVGEPVDAIHSAVDRAGKGTTSSNPESRGVPNGDALSDDGTVSENAPTLRGPKAQTTHPYPLSSLLHPFSALGATQNAATNNVAVTTDTSTADDTEPTPPRPIRRNTTGSTNLVSKSKSQANTAAASTTGITAWDSGLDEDMKKQAEQIRRERKRREEEAEEQEKFAKEKKESKGKERGRDRTGQHARSGSAGGRSLGARSIGNKSMEEWKPVVGNVVGEGHVNYILMYNMLTGIRVAVSRCQAKPPRTLTDEDFTAAHNVKRGNKENIRSNTLKVFKPDIKDVPDLDAAPGTRRWIGIKHAMEVRRAILVAQRQHLSTIASEQGNSTTSQTRERTSRDKGYSKDRSIPKPSPLHTLESSNLPEEDPLPSDRSGFIFYSDDGGYRATDDLDREWRGGPGGKTVVNGKIVDDEEAVEKADGEGVVYYLGVIDILTRWTLTKKAEHVYKGLKADKHKISPVNPNEYGDRFFSFLQAIMRGGEGPDKFV